MKYAQMRQYDIANVEGYSREIRHVRHGDRIAQLVIAPVIDANFYEVEDIKKTKRGSGGFGSTGK